MIHGRMVTSLGPNQEEPQTGAPEAPAHDPVGGADSLLSIIDPTINWEYGSYDLGTDSLGTPIGDFSESLIVDSDSSERCGGSSLFTVLIQTDSSSGDSYLRNRR